MRAHRWLGDHCTSCAMARDWPGARQDCPVADRQSHRARTERRAAARASRRPGLARMRRADIARLVRER